MTRVSISLLLLDPEVSVLLARKGGIQAGLRGIVPLSRCIAVPRRSGSCHLLLPATQLEGGFCE